MITRFVKVLRELYTDIIDEDIADILWLALQMQSSPTAGPTETPEPDGQKLGKEKEHPHGTSSDSATPASPVSNIPQTPSGTEQSGAEIHHPTQSGSGTKHDQKGGLAFRSPAVTALPGSLGLGRALRPLMRRVPSRTKYAIDEEITTQRIADQLLAGQSIVLPVLRPVSLRWLEVVLVIDESRSMTIWRPTINAFKQVLERHGAFRDVRTWGLVLNTNGQVRLRPWGARTDKVRLGDPDNLLDPNGRRLILVVSDCISDMWYGASMLKVLNNWGSKGPLAIIQVLPQRLWSRTMLGDAIEVQLHAGVQGPSNRKLDYEPASYLIEKKELTGKFPVPVVALRQESFVQWVKATIMAGNAWAPGYMFDLHPESFAREDLSGLSAKQRIQRFSNISSPTARTLVGLLASAPISLPVIRLIQHTMLPQSDLGHAAEVLLGGLIEHTNRKDEYDFVEGVRDLLLSVMPKSQSLQVMINVSDFIESHTNQSLDMRALLADPTSVTGLTVDDASRPFATVALKVLHKLGGDYRVLAERLEKMVSPSSFQRQPLQDEDTTTVQSESLYRPPPVPTGQPPYHLSLEEVLSPARMQAIYASGKLVFHIAGNTGGVKSPEAQQLVAQKMLDGFYRPDSEDNPAFFYILGDVVYYYGEAANYGTQFYEPYKDYPAPIFAIPGNHDGAVFDKTTPSLAGFIENFCSPKSQWQREIVGTSRKPMIQPHVYWTLETPFATIIGLYTGVPEGGRLDNAQLAWLEAELANAPVDKALLLMMHHPAYSADVQHLGSRYIEGVLDRAIEKTGRIPDAIFASHVVNYQRFTRLFRSCQIPYLIVGAGGYWHLHQGVKVKGRPIKTPYRAIPEKEVILDRYCDDSHGYLRVEITNQTLQGMYYAAPHSPSDPAQLRDSFMLDSKEHRVSSDRIAGAKMLWVDDRPDNNIFERREMEAVGIQITLSTSTEDALEKVHSDIYDVIISDMGRQPPDPQAPYERRAGYTLLDSLRDQHISTPFIIYAGSSSRRHQEETKKRGGFGTTNIPGVLFQMVIDAIQQG